MDKNVSGVDLEELMKAREELDKERGVETDPNLYSDYNPNRNKEETESFSVENATMENNYDNITNPNNEENEDLKHVSQEELSTEIAESETKESDTNHDSHDLNNYSNSEENLSKFNAFAAFEVKENAPEDIFQEVKTDEIKNTSEKTAESGSEISDEELDKRLEDIDNADELESFLTDLLNDIENDEAEESSAAVVDDQKSETTADEMTKNITDEPQEQSEENMDNIREETATSVDSSSDMIAGIDIEPKFDDLNYDVTDETPEVQDVSDDKIKSDELSENIMEIKSESPIINTSLDDFIPTEEIKESADSTEIETQNNPLIDNAKDEELEHEIKSDLDDVQDLYLKKLDESSNDDEIAESNLNDDAGQVNDTQSETETKFDTEPQNQEIDDEENLETSEENTDEESIDITNDETEGSAENEIEDTKPQDEISEESEDLNNEADEEELDEENEAEEESEPDEDSEDEISDLNEEDIGKYIKRANDPIPSEKKKKQQAVYAENTMVDADAEVITDYSQLRDILEKQLQEPVEIDEEEFKRKHLYKAIEDFKFIDEITTNDFKTSDNFSYILGKNEEGEMIYGNFKEHCNLAVFGKNDSVTNSMLNSLILSLCLKNSYHDLNFVLLDSDINSSFEVYNKSSYLYFNRIAKTNKEILDTLIEVSKEVDNRYQQLASIGVKNIDTYNEVAAENNLQTMPYVIVVFNNYTSASQATDHDKINACLYQILKYGRITGFYAVVCAKTPIEITQVNYSLSSRLSFKSDENSKFTVGSKDVEYLPGENDAVYFNIASNKTEHIKVATVTDIELDLIIKDLEE